MKGETTQEVTRRERLFRKLHVRSVALALLGLGILWPSWESVSQFKEPLASEVTVDRNETGFSALKDVAALDPDKAAFAKENETQTIDSPEEKVPNINPSVNDAAENISSTMDISRAKVSTRGREGDDTKRSPALDFVEGRRKAYELANATQTWAMRGIGFLFSKHQIVLEAFLPEPRDAGQAEVTIRNVYDPSVIRKDCDKLTIWVRVNGPEIFAGSALAVFPQGDKSSCFWKFPFDLKLSGTYQLDAKVLLWNGYAPVIANNTESPCLTFQSELPAAVEKAHPLHSGFLGFKMYGPSLMCCEICSRMVPDCTYWATPPSHPNEEFSSFRNGCELYYNKDIQPIVSNLLQPLPPTSKNRRRLGPLQKEHGYPYTSQDTAYFLGCGWSYHFTLDFPCLSGDLDDRVFDKKKSFTLEAPNERKASSPVLPHCRLEDEHDDHGRWVRGAWPNATTCPRPMKVGKKNKFTIMEFDGENPLCWNREDLGINGNTCMEMNCKLISKSSKWISSMREEKKWFGMWRPYDCSYLEFTNSQLQQCVEKRKIASFKTSGKSIAAFLNEYLDFRLRNITLAATGKGSIEVTLDTLQLLHLAHLPDGAFEEKMKALPTVDPETKEHFFVSGFYLSSEREVYAHVAKMQQLNQIALALLKPKGYKMINAFDMTAAFTYDTATQMDGMHIIGPPMKTVITKLFHHICQDVVEGRPM